MTRLDGMRATVGSVGLAVALVAVSVAYLLVVVAPALATTGAVIRVVELTQWTLMVGFPVAIAGAGLQLRTLAPGPTEQCLVGRWTLAGVLAVVLLTVAATMAEFAQPGHDLWALVPAFVIGAEGGAAFGMLLGYNALRSRRDFVAIETQRDALHFLTDSLRHNVLNAVTVIDGQAGLIAEADADSDEEVTVIRTRATQLTATVRELGLLTRAATDGWTGEVDLSALVRDEVQSAASANPGVTFETDIEPSVRVQGSRGLTPVVSHLLLNAVRYNASAAPTVTVTLHRNGEGAMLAVADNGRGIAPEYRERIFERKPRGDEPADLYMARTLLSRVNGRIWVEENEPRGSVVNVWLPLVG